MIPTIMLIRAFIVALPGKLINRSKLGLIIVATPIMIGINPKMINSVFIVNSIVSPKYNCFISV